MNAKEICCKICHVTFGFLTVLSSKICITLPLVFLATFILYEMDEEWNIGDHAIEELREYGTGLALGLIWILEFSKYLFF